MERFHFDLAEAKPFTLIFPHIPKTGGTTLLYHFRRNLGDNNILSYGPHNRNVRFFMDLPQLEELRGPEIAKLRVVQGHAVGEDILPFFSEEPVRLLVVLRNPLALTRSRFNQRRIGLANRGIEVTTDSFMKGEEGDFFSRLLVSKFRSFMDPVAKTRKDRVISILRKFDYVFTTERLDQQVAGLMKSLDLPVGLERRRVSEDKAPLDVDDQLISDLNPVDTEVFNMANTVIEGSERHNPFGFDSAARDTAVESIPARDGGELQSFCYDRLSTSLCLELRAEAALEKLARASRVAVTDRDMFASRLKEAWQHHREGLSAERLAMSKSHLEAWKQHNP